MRKLFVLSFLVFISSVSLAKIWRVDQNPLTKPDFTQAADAIGDSKVLPGDTLYIAGSQNAYNDIVVNKRLTIIGNGYFLNENPNTPVDKRSTNFGIISLIAGAELSEIMGVATDKINVNCDNVVLRRNFVSGYGNSTIEEVYGIKISANISHIRIKQNYLQTSDAHIYGQTSKTIKILANCNDIIIMNNYINTRAFSSSMALLVDGTSSVWIENNTIQGNTTIGNSVVKNNFFVWSSIEGTPVMDGNYFLDVPIENVIVNTGSTDGKWKLKEGSPAKTAGVNGTECGMFGGDEPYVLSGIPPIPIIYEAGIPDKATNQSGLPVKINAKTNK